MTEHKKATKINSRTYMRKLLVLKFKFYGIHGFEMLHETGFYRRVSARLSLHLNSGFEGTH